MTPNESDKTTCMFRPAGTFEERAVSAQDHAQSCAACAQKLAEENSQAVVDLSERDASLGEAFARLLEAGTIPGDLERDYVDGLWSNLRHLVVEVGLAFAAVIALLPGSPPWQQLGGLTVAFVAILPAFVYVANRMARRWLRTVMAPAARAARCLGRDGDAGTADSLQLGKAAIRTFHRLARDLPALGLAAYASYLTLAGLLAFSSFWSWFSWAAMSFTIGAFANQSLWRLRLHFLDPIGPLLSTQLNAEKRRQRYADLRAASVASSRLEKMLSRIRSRFALNFTAWHLFVPLQVVYVTVLLALACYRIVVGDGVLRLWIATTLAVTTLASVLAATILEMRALRADEHSPGARLLPREHRAIIKLASPSRSGGLLQLRYADTVLLQASTAEGLRAKVKGSTDIGPHLKIVEAASVDITDAA